MTNPINALTIANAVERFLADKTLVTMSDVARELLGRGYPDVTTAEWGMLAGAMKGAGWRSRKVEGVYFWSPVPRAMVEGAAP